MFDAMPGAKKPQHIHVVGDHTTLTGGYKVSGEVTRCRGGYKVLGEVTR